jgi:asparagine synthase (glutamine-hydrolysing)
MVASMEHEPSYLSGTYSAAELGVYGGWVAHENSFGSDQVFFGDGKNIALLVSGECFIDLQSSSTGNSLVRIYDEGEAKFFENLNGLFSGLLIDKRQGKAFLFNDRYGVERIYWHENADGFYFASEAKALLRVLPELRAFDEEGVAQFLTFGCTLEGRSLFRNVQLLPGASVWSFANGRRARSTYFSPESWEAQPSLSPESFAAELQETFERVLPRYLESDSRLGISLTGGLDTRMIMAARPETAEAPICYTFSGTEGRTLDDRVAKRVAEVEGLEHRLLRIGPDFFSGFASHVDRTVHLTDGCFGVTGAHEIYLNRLARELATVRVTGNYGSEVLRGVSTLKPIGLAPALLKPDFQRSFATQSSLTADSTLHPVTFAAFKEIPWNLYGSLAAARSQLTVRTPFLDNRIVALAYQAPEDLRRSAYPAANLIKRLSPALYRIPTDMGEMGGRDGAAAGLRRLVSKITFKADWVNNEGLPSFLSAFDPMFQHFASGLRIVGLHKYLHYRSWFRKDLAGYVTEKLKKSRVRQSPFWNSGFIDQMAAGNLEGRGNYVREINAVLTLEAVERLLFREVSPGPDIRQPDAGTGRPEHALIR